VNEIFIVEDEKEIRENLEILLDAEGYDVISAGNGLEALKKLESITPDLILCDIMMPYLNGMELFQRIKENDKARAIPFIFLTAKNDLTSLRQGMNLGADDYLTKPFATDDLLRAIKTRLEIKKTINQQIDEIRNNVNMYVPNELKTPLVAIMGYSQLIMSEIESIEKKDILDMVERINFASKRLYNQVEKFIQLSDLDLFTADNDNGENIISEIDKELIREILLCHHIIRERKDDITTSIEPAEVRVTNKLLNILLTELIENAVKFSEPGTLIIVDGKKENRFYLLEIKDFGNGMEDLQIQSVSSLRQIECHKRRERKGLGLLTVTKIINSIEGEFKIENINDNHTIITVKIPLADF